MNIEPNTVVAIFKNLGTWGPLVAIVWILTNGFLKYTKMQTDLKLKQIDADLNLQQSMLAMNSEKTNTIRNGDWNITSEAEPQKIYFG